MEKSAEIAERNSCQFPSCVIARLQVSVPDVSEYFFDLFNAKSVRQQFVYCLDMLKIRFVVGILDYYFARFVDSFIINVSF
jgi:hypothetical protein